MSFAQYVKANYDDVRHLPSKQRMKALSVMYKGGDKPKGGVLSGAGFLSNALDSIGLGLDAKPKQTKGKKTKGGLLSGAGLRQLGVSSSERAPRNMGGYVPPSVPVDMQYSAGTAPFPSLSSQTRQAMGLRMNSNGQSYQGVGMVASPTMVSSAGSEHGGGIFSSLLGAVGLGLPVEKAKRGRGRPAKAKPAQEVMVPKRGRGRPRKQPAEHGGGIFSNIVSAFGL
jgi:hypothetical protein